MLEIKNLRVKYKGAKKSSIGNISLKIVKGDRVAILGPSGCGKTTLLHIIAGILREKEADIEGVLDWRSNEKMPSVRIVFQESTLLPWKTVEKNIALGLELKKVPKVEIEKQVKKILKMVGLSESAKKLPHQLSIGMQQRVNFARALICQPNLLLLDEPFSALDSITKKSLQSDFLRLLNEKEITSILVTHSMQEAKLMSNKIIELSHGPSVIKQIIDNNQ